MPEKLLHAPNGRIESGILGLDDILGGGLTPHRMYLVEGAPGAFKMTLIVQFFLRGVEKNNAGV